MSLKRFVLTVTLAFSLPLMLQAHRQWMLPSSTVLSNTNTWVTIDAAVSNELFYFDHVPLRVTNLTIMGPDGVPLKAQNVSTGKYRTTFDVQLPQAGTYRIAMVNNTVFATWKDKGETKNWRGTAEAFKTEVPSGVEDLKSSRMSSRVEVFVTAGKPSSKALEPSGTGLEMVPVTHPNDLVVGEPATFGLLLDGKPAANLEVTLIPGGIRYRDQLKEVKLKTDAQGKFTTTFSEPGMYWMNAVAGAAVRPSAPGLQTSTGVPVVPAAQRQGPPAGGQPTMPSGDRASYTATLEVLPQ